jgi:hypothetical protein
VLAVYLGQPRAPGTDLAGDIGGLVGVGPVRTGSPLDRALGELTSGERAELAPAATLEIAASFADAGGRLCREVRLLRDSIGRIEQAVACTAGDGWTVEIVVGAARDTTDGDVYAPASGPGSRAIERLLDEIGAGPALSPDEEAAARARGWQP